MTAERLPVSAAQPRAFIPAAEVAPLMGFTSGPAFLTRRAALEKIGFPSPAPWRRRPLMRLDDPDKFTASTGCNTLSGDYVLDPAGLRFTPGPMTMMACPDPLMAVERGFMDALKAVTSFDFDQDSGALVLMAQDRAVVTAVPAP